MIFEFIGIDQLPESASSRCYLVRDHWDDWFAFDTRYTLIVFDSAGKRHIAGNLKIGQSGLIRAKSNEENIPLVRSPNLPESPFYELGDNYFSIGLGDDYYETIIALGSDARQAIMKGLRDCAFDLNIFKRFEDEDVMQTSLLRYTTVENVLNRFHRLANGNAILTRYHFEFDLPGNELNTSGPKISFLVEPNTEPPTNVHVLIGRNGVGKSRCIQSLTATVLELEDTPHIPKGTLSKLGQNSDKWEFSGLVHVSFSAFDSFAFPSMKTQRKIKGTFVGLPNLIPSESNPKPNLKESLALQFVRSFEACRTGLRAERWKDAIQALCSDPILEDANVIELLDLKEDEWEDRAIWFFQRLSSGHAIVLLTTTRLVELVDERTLVILDEPEGHLHPPLLSAFVRAISKLLIARNGVAIIATHSPVVLQEVPASCVSILTRTDYDSEINPPNLETFGESIGILTREVFELEVTRAGFHALIHQQVQNGKSFEQLLKHFGRQLGSEAQFLARSLTATRDAKSGKL